ncbi:MAG: SLC13 family permease, partial [Parvibaculum sp.]|uniref:SLC13 family permease n=1 Tax=Parvibaculum sp. TaxID=2024848 RepID=UPI001B120169
MEIAYAWQMWVTYGLILAAVVLFSIERLSLELSALGILVALLVFFYFFPVIGEDGRNLLGSTALLAGFANPALIAVLALLVVGHGMFQTGALDGAARYVADLGSTRPRTTIFFTFLLVAVISAFLNNTPVAVMFIPVLATLAMRFGQRAPKVMMTLSYVSILGGMTTLIGSSTNLLVAEQLRTISGVSLDFFTPTVPGLFLAAFGLVYIVFVLPRLLPDRDTMEGELAGSGEGRQYIAQIE